MKTIFKVLENTFGLMKELIKGNGLQIKCMGKDTSLGVTVKNIKENI